MKWYARKTKFSPRKHKKYGFGSAVYQVHFGPYTMPSNYDKFNGLVGANNRDEALSRAKHLYSEGSSGDA